MTRVALVSLEPWDDIWRRNQHLASRLVRSGRANELTFITPPVGGFAARARRWSPEPGITVVTPPLVIPRRYGGFRALAAWLRAETHDADILWINDPVAGAALATTDRPMTYDVTDDWRSMPQPDGDRRRTIAGEDALARVARTVVCSPALRERWHARYGIDATLIPNAVDVDAIRAANPRPLTGPGPHAVYVGTLHENRIDSALLADLITRWPGTVHLVGPVSDGLAPVGAEVVGPVPSSDVPSWLNAADVLICPHLVDDFTLSLDAIKSHEYLATDRPIVATPSSGFQDLTAPGLTVTTADTFVKAAHAAVGTGPTTRDVAVDWDVRASAFAETLGLRPSSHPSDRT